VVLRRGRRLAPLRDRDVVQHQLPAQLHRRVRDEQLLQGLRDRVHVHPAGARARVPAPGAVREGGMSALHSPKTAVERSIAALVLVLMAVGPLMFSDYWVSFMITLTFGVIAFYFFGQVTLVSGFSGIAGIDGFTPGIVGSPTTQPTRLYYIALVVAVLVYLLIRYVVLTPFGLTLQGIRDEPVRM